MTLLDAVIAVIDEANATRRSYPGAIRTQKALTVLGLNRDQAISVMYRLEICDEEGKLYPVKRGQPTMKI